MRKGREPRKGLTFSIKGKINIEVFAGRVLSVITTHLCCCSVKAAIDNTEMIG